MVWSSDWELKRIGRRGQCELLSSFFTTIHGIKWRHFMPHVFSETHLMCTFPVTTESLCLWAPLLYVSSLDLGQLIGPSIQWRNNSTYISEREFFSLSSFHFENTLALALFSFLPAPRPHCQLLWSFLSYFAKIITAFLSDTAFRFEHFQRSTKTVSFHNPLAHFIVVLIPSNRVPFPCIASWWWLCVLKGSDDELSSLWACQL